MNISALIKLTIFTNLIAANLFSFSAAKASTFEEQEMNQEQIIAVAAPYRHGYNLVVIEQLPGKDRCWAEQGIAPVSVDALLMNFDFSGHCRRATDSNGYSVRIGGEERGSDYLLKIVEQDNELILVATQRDPNQRPLIIGRTNGRQADITKIFLNPGWRFTKRSYQGKELSHFYFSEGAAPLANTTQQSQPVSNKIASPSASVVQPTGQTSAPTSGINVMTTINLTLPQENVQTPSSSVVINNSSNNSTAQEVNQLF
ncbi:MAG: DUF3747 domain-containing protein [Cyanobacteria bacterium J06600_6]